jgi:hypothetical protein
MLIHTPFVDPLDLVGVVPSSFRRISATTTLRERISLQFLNFVNITRRRSAKIKEQSVMSAASAQASQKDTPS